VCVNLIPDSLQTTTLNESDFSPDFISPSNNNVCNKTFLTKTSFNYFNNNSLSNQSNNGSNLIKKSHVLRRVSRTAQPQNARRKVKQNLMKTNLTIQSEGPLKISILGLFEMSNRYGKRDEGKSELAAAQLAVKHINKINLLKEYTLELITNDTKVKCKLK
jgi:hypothetical protein